MNIYSSVISFIKKLYFKILWKSEFNKIICNSYYPDVKTFIDFSQISFLTEMESRIWSSRVKGSLLYYREYKTHFCRNVSPKIIVFEEVQKIANEFYNKYHPKYPNHSDWGDIAEQLMEIIYFESSININLISKHWKNLYLNVLSTQKQIHHENLKKIAEVQEISFPLDTVKMEISVLLLGEIKNPASLIWDALGTHGVTAHEISKKTGLELETVMFYIITFREMNLLIESTWVGKENTYMRDSSCGDCNLLNSIKIIKKITG